MYQCTDFRVLAAPLSVAFDTGMTAMWICISTVRRRTNMTTNLQGRTADPEVTLAWAVLEQISCLQSG
jgi:hypothetical protein